eukprot:scaffold81874_cov50-Cyclotella_meneghiniana.AAC.8
MNLLRAWTSRHTAIGLVALLDVHWGPSCPGCSVGSSPTSSPSRRSSDIHGSFTTCVHNHPTTLVLPTAPLFEGRDPTECPRKTVAAIQRA